MACPPCSSIRTRFANTSEAIQALTHFSTVPRNAADFPRAREGDAHHYCSESPR